ncbi:hypothetical protein GJ496_011441, partial [Pomphorhynchus laevis]
LNLNNNLINQLHDLTKRVNGVQYLWLDYNLIERVEPLFGLSHNFYVLDLSYNILSAVQVRNLPDLELRLTCNTNNFTFECNTQLTDLRFNRLQSHQITQKKILTSILLLDYNLLVDLHFLSAETHIYHLKYLSCSHNLISTINEDFFALAFNLEKLDLSHNRIVYIPNGFLSNKHTISHVNLSFNMITKVSAGAFHNMLGLQDIRLFGNPITEIPSGFVNLSSQLKSIEITLKHLQCPNISGISNQIEEIKFAGCEINIKDFLGLDQLTSLSILSANITSMDFLYHVKVSYLAYLSLSGNIIKELDFAIFKFIPNVHYLNLSFNRIVTITKAQLPTTYNLKSLDLRGNGICNLIQNYDSTGRQLSDYMDNLIKKRSRQIDYNMSLPILNLINNSALPQVLCLHSMCIPGKHIERIVRKQTISNPYGYTCPAMYSKHNEFKYSKIDRGTSSTELLAKHVFPCAEHMEIIDNGGAGDLFIFEIVRYNVKSLILYNSNMYIMESHICPLYKLSELSLINVSEIDNAIDRMSCLKSLSKLDMSFNRITEFSKLYDILLCAKLQILNLSFNDIEYLKYVNETTSQILSKSILEVLDLSNNKLTLLTIQWVLTPSLRVLNCSYNQIRFVYFGGALLDGNARLLSTLNLENNQNLTFEQNIFDYLTGLTEIDLSDTNLSSDSLPENIVNLCKIYLNRNSLWEYVRFTCKYNSEYEIYLSGNHIQNAKAVRMFYFTRVLDISYNLLRDLLGFDCKDISETKILNVSSNMINTIDVSFSAIMKFLEELDLSNNPLKNIQRYDIGIDTRLRKLILANSDLQEIAINISLPWNVPSIDLRKNSRIRRVNVITKSICEYPLQLYITSLCDISTRNCPYSGEQLKRYAFARWLQSTNDNVDLIQINCANLHIITDSWICKSGYKLLLHLECTGNN